MIDYRIVKQLTDYSILESNLHKLNFIKGVAIYYDKTKTDREVNKLYRYFDEELEAFCKYNAIPFYEYRALVKSFLQEVENELLVNFVPSKVFSLPDDLYKKLLAGYNYMALVERGLPIEHNYSLVSDDGTFLFSKHHNPWGYFCSNINITEEGLFKCEMRDYQKAYNYQRSEIQGTIEISIQEYICDTEGNWMYDYKFLACLKILNSSSSDYLTHLSQRNDYNFNIRKDNYYEYQEKYEGKEDVEWEKLLPNGLTFYYWVATVPGSDYRHYIKPCLRDQFGNSAEIDDFYLTLKMLQNGKDYLQALTSHYLKSEVDRLK